MYTCPWKRETLLLLHIVFPVFLYAVTQDIILIYTTRREDLLPRALYRNDSKAAGCYRDVSTSCLFAAEKNVRLVESRGLLSYGGCERIGRNGADGSIVRRARTTIQIGRVRDRSAWPVRWRARNLQVKRFHPCGARSPSAWWFARWKRNRTAACESRGASHARMHARGPMRVDMCDWWSSQTHDLISRIYTSSRLTSVSYKRRVVKMVGARFLDHRYRSSSVP